MNEVEIKYFDENGASVHITGPDHTGTVRQQVNYAVMSFGWICQLDLGYAMDDVAVRNEIERSLSNRGVDI